MFFTVTAFRSYGLENTMAHKKQKSSSFEKSGLALAGAEVAAIAQRKKAFESVTAADLHAVDKPSSPTSKDRILPRSATPPVPAPRRKNVFPSQPGKQPPKPLPRTKLPISQSMPMVLDTDSLHSHTQTSVQKQPPQTVIRSKQPPPPVAQKPALNYQQKQLAEGSCSQELEDSYSRRSTLPQSWKVGSHRPRGSEHSFITEPEGELFSSTSVIILYQLLS